MTTITFMCPTVFDVPPVDVQGDPANKLFRHYGPRARSVNVFVLQDGTIVQDTPTAENRNNAVPYPIGSPDNLVSRGWDPFTLSEFSTPVINPVVKIYYGGHIYTLSTDEAAQLTAAGYGNWITTGP